MFNQCVCWENKYFSFRTFCSSLIYLVKIISNLSWHLIFWVKFVDYLVANKRNGETSFCIFRKQFLLWIQRLPDQNNTDNKYPRVTFEFVQHALFTTDMNSILSKDALDSIQMQDDTDAIKPFYWTTMSVAHCNFICLCSNQLFNSIPVLVTICMKMTLFSNGNAIVVLLIINVRLCLLHIRMDALIDWLERESNISRWIVVDEYWFCVNWIWLLWLCCRLRLMVTKRNCGIFTWLNPWIWLQFKQTDGQEGKFHFI